MVAVDPDLTPADAAVAVRSFPRRFRGVLASASDPDRVDHDDPDELARRHGPDGTSAVEHLVAADHVLGLLQRALRDAHRPEATVPAVFADLEATSWGDSGESIDALLDQLEQTATATAGAIGAVPSDRWGTELAIEGAHDARPLIALLRETVAVAAAHLRRARTVLDAVR